MKNYMKQDSATKIAILKPLLNDWNECIEDNWTIEKFNERSCTIRRASLEKGGVPMAHPSFHGSLLTDIAGICNAYRWTFAIYHDEEIGLYINI